MCKKICVRPDLNISLDQDLADFVIASARRWHGERIVVLLTFMVYGFATTHVVRLKLFRLKAEGVRRARLPYFGGNI